MPKICDAEGVRGGEEGFPIEIWRDDDTGRLVVVGYNQAGNDGVGIDLWDLITWLRSGTDDPAIESIRCDFAALSAPQGEVERLGDISLLLSRMKCRIDDWDEEAPRRMWWEYQLEYFDAYSLLAALAQPKGGDHG